MRRNLIRFGHYAAALLLLCCLLPVTAGAEEAMPEYDGYIFKLREDLAPVSLMADEAGDLPEGISALEFGYFKADDMDTLAALTEADWLEVVEPDYVMELMGEVPAAYPNDTYYKNGSQWGLEAIDMSYAWENGYDGTGVVVGMVDSGLKPDHEDMVYDGHVLPGYNFVTNTTDTTDERGHGSMVAGIIGAATNNGKGIAGIAPGAKLMPLKMFGATGVGGFASQACAAIKYGVDNGCDILNMSIGLFKKSDFLESAVDYALDRGVILIAAAGNGDDKDSGPNQYTKPCYPAAYDGVIAVSRLDQSGEDIIFSPESQHNASVDIAAPGGRIGSFNSAGGYSYWNGTSCSAPMVTAAVALCKEAEPNLTGERFLELLKDTSMDGWDEYYGYGMLNVTNLLKAIEEEVQAWGQANRRYDGVVVSTGKLTLDVNGYTEVRALVAGYDGQGRMVGYATQEAAVGAGNEVRLDELVLDLAALPDRVELLLLDPETWAALAEPVVCELGTQ